MKSKDKTVPLPGTFQRRIYKNQVLTLKNVLLKETE